MWVCFLDHWQIMWCVYACVCVCVWMCVCVSVCVCVISGAFKIIDRPMCVRERARIFVCGCCVRVRLCVCLRDHWHICVHVCVCLSLSLSLSLPLARAVSRFTGKNSLKPALRSFYIVHWAARWLLRISTHPRLIENTLCMLQSQHEPFLSLEFHR